MKSWQSYARIGAALVGVLCAGVVYVTLGGRRSIAPAVPVERIDPTAVLETTGGDFQRVEGSEQAFDIKADRSLFYEGGSVVQHGVTITARNRGGRDFVVSAREARSERNEEALQLTGDVKLGASDGFGLATDRGAFDRATGVASSPGEVSFEKGRMRGSGVGMTYAQATDVLQILDRAEVMVAGEEGGLSLHFSAREATLDRLQHLLVLAGDVRVQREGQRIQGDRAKAVLSDDLAFVTRIELRGGARVDDDTAALDTMSAQDIDLDYDDNGQVLESVVLVGSAALSMRGEAGSPGRRLTGQRLDLRLSADGSLNHAIGAGQVGLDLAGAPDVRAERGGTEPGEAARSARRIRAESMEAAGEPGRGLTKAEFSGDVQYREGPADEGAARVVRSGRLDLALSGDAVTDAHFSGLVTFEDSTLVARANDMRYRPMQGALALTGRDTRGSPRVEDSHLTVDADVIDIGLDPRRITARDGVKTTIVATETSPDRARAAGTPDPTPPRTVRAAGTPDPTPPRTVRAAGTPERLPGILRQNESANVNADGLSYESATGQIRYVGHASLWQGATAIRGDTITIDQTSGNLVASGSARSVIPLDKGTSVGRADEIRYDESDRTLLYAGTLPAPPRAGPPLPVPAPPAPGSLAQLTGPEGDLSARRITVFLAPGAGRAERLEGEGDVTSTVGTRALTGTRLTYWAADERYEVSGRAGAPVRLVDSCRETVGTTLTFFKSTDRILVEGGDVGRTRTESRSVCPPAANR